MSLSKAIHISTQILQAFPFSKLFWQGKHFASTLEKGASLVRGKNLLSIDRKPTRNNFAVPHSLEMLYLSHSMTERTHKPDPRLHFRGVLCSFPTITIAGTFSHGADSFPGILQPSLRTTAQVVYFSLLPSGHCYFETKSRCILRCPPLLYMARLYLWNDRSTYTYLCSQRV